MLGSWNLEHEYAEGIWSRCSRFECLRLVEVASLQSGSETEQALRDAEAETLIWRHWQDCWAGQFWVDSWSILGRPRMTQNWPITDSSSTCFEGAVLVKTKRVCGWNKRIDVRARLRHALRYAIDIRHVEIWGVPPFTFPTSQRREGQDLSSLSFSILSTFNTSSHMLTYEGLKSRDHWCFSHFQDGTCTKPGNRNSQESFLAEPSFTTKTEPCLSLKAVREYTGNPFPQKKLAKKDTQNNRTVPCANRNRTEQSLCHPACWAICLNELAARKRSSVKVQFSLTLTLTHVEMIAGPELGAPLDD